MKNRLFALLLALVMVLPVCALADEAADAVTSASVADFYGDYGLSGDALMDAINSFSGFYLISTTNPDGTPNSAYFIYAMVKHEDRYYLQLGLAENQSKANLQANGPGRLCRRSLHRGRREALCRVGRPHSFQGC